MKTLRLSVLGFSALALVFGSLIPNAHAASGRVNLHGTIASMVNTDQEQSLVVEQSHGKISTVHLMDYTKVLRTGSHASDFSDWKTADRVVVHGRMQADGSVNAILIRNQTLLPGNVPANSEITQIDGVNNLVTAVKGNKTPILHVTEDTDIVIGPMLDQSLSNLQVGQKIFRAYGPYRKGEPIEATRIAVTDVSADSLLYKHDSGTMTEMTSTTITVKNANNESTTYTLGTDTVHFDRNFGLTDAEALQLGDTVELWNNLTTSAAIWVRNESVKTVSTKGVLATIAEKNDATMELTLSWTGNLYVVKVSDVTKITVGKNEAATFADLKVGMSVHARGTENLETRVITAEKIYSPKTIMTKDGKGTGRVYFKGNGQASFTGTGTVQAKGKQASVIVMDEGALDAQVTTNGTGTSVQLSDGVMRYTGYGSITIKGSDVTVTIEGNGIQGIAEGVGSYYLTGNGTYRTAKTKVRNIPTQGIVLNVVEA